MMHYTVIDDPTSCYYRYHYFKMYKDDFNSDNDYYSKINDIFEWLRISSFLGNVIIAPTRERLMSERYDFSIFVLLFEKSDDAILFKLRWY